MNKKNTVIIITIIVSIIGIYFFVKDWNATTEKLNNPIVASVPEASPTPIVPADSLEVIHFHATQQCVSCITVGKYALKTITDSFPQEVASGRIVFKEINIDLPENKDIAMKYQVSGSALFINAIRDGKDYMSEDITVWRLISSESKFITYFKEKLAALLGQ